MDTQKKKSHADFQDAYRRSSNFRSVIKKEKLELNKDGEVKLSASN
jgi:hypothetical protein